MPSIVKTDNVQPYTEAEVTINELTSNSISVTGGSITGITDLAVADGGTGASTAGDARTNLGLGTIATQAASAVAITGGTIAGITDLAVADGGTGASTAGDARTNLGAAASGANTDITSLNAPALGAATATTQSPGTDNTTVATTAFVATALSSAGLPKNYLTGCTLSNNSGDATNDIDIAAGECRDSTDAVDITVAALTKQLDANWVAGTGQGMRYSGAAIANTTYHIWAVSTAAGTQDIYATPNASASTASAALALLQAETGGSSYIYARRIGSILRESAAIVGFVQNGDEFMRKTSVLDVNATNPGSSAVTRTLSVALGVRVKAIVNAFVDNDGAADGVYLSDLSLTDSAPSSSAAPLANLGNILMSTTRGLMAGPIGVWTNTSGQIRSRLISGASSSSLKIATMGWIDPRI